MGLRDSNVPWLPTDSLCGDLFFTYFTTWMLFGRVLLSSFLPYSTLDKDTYLFSRWQTESEGDRLRVEKA